MRRPIPEAVGREEREHHRERGGGLREQRGVVEPEMRIRGGEQRRDQPGAIPREPAAEQSDQPDRRRAEHARHEPVPQARS